MDRRRKSLLSTLTSVGLALICYLLVLAISNDHQKAWDLTSERRFSFSEQTQKVVGDLSVPVKLYAFPDPEGDSSSIETLLDRYRRLNKNFTYELVDLEKKPTLAESLEVRAYGQGVLELVSGSTGGQAPPRRERLMTFDEASITNALMKLTSEGERRVAFLTGHGERPIVGSGKETLSAMVAALTSEGYRSETLNLTQAKTLPADLTLLVLAGPTSPLLPGEQTEIAAYLQRGGKMLFLADISTPASYSQWLATLGFELPETIVVDSAAELAKADIGFAIGQDYSGEHPITKNFVDFTGFRLGRPVRPSEAGAPPLGEGGSTPKVEILVHTAQSAFAVPIAQVRQGQASISADLKEAAKFPLAVAALYPRQANSEAPEQGEGAAETPVSARIVVIGNTDAFTNSLFAFVSNRDFILNTVNWLAESENQITVRTKDPKSQPLVLEKQKEKWLGFVFCLLLPFLSVLTGVLIHFGRRRGLA